MRNRVLKLVFSVSLLAILIFTLIYSSKDDKSKTGGNITVIVNNINNEIVSEKRIKYNSGDTLYDVISSEYDVICDESIYGLFLLGIKGNDFDITANSDFSSWLWIEVAYIKEDTEYNDKIDFNDYIPVDVNTGIDGIELKDNMIFAVNERDNDHNTSIFGQSIDINNMSYFKNVFKIIVILATIILLVVIITIFIYKTYKYNAKITTKELCVLAFMTAILFVQEQLLSFIPNVQFTFMLISLYTVVFGLKRTSIIVFVHVLLDNIIMGSINPVVMLPMLIGYEILALLVYFVKNKGLVLITIMSVIGTIIYCFSFLVANTLFLDVNFIAYFIADIPFQILLITSTIITMMYAYKPLEKILKSNWS